MISNPAWKETADTVAKCRNITNKPHGTLLFPCFLYAVLIVGFSVSKQQLFFWGKHTWGAVWKHGACQSHLCC